MEALGPAGSRNLTNSAQNYLVLKMASALVEGSMTKQQVEDAHGPAVAFEAQAAADSRKELLALQVPVHMSVVWAMYNEKNRMHRHTGKYPHGEDFVRTKVVQLDWLTKDLPGITWSIIACDDGCPQKSAERMEKIVRQEKYPRNDGHRSVKVLKLADVIGNVSIGTAFNKLTSTDESRKGGAIVAGIDAAIKAGPVQANGSSPHRHVVCFTEDFAATNFRSVEPGASHLRMVKQIVGIYQEHVAKGGTPATGDAASLLKLLEGLDLSGYQALIRHISHKDAGETSLFDRRWPVQELLDVINPPE